MELFKMIYNCYFIFYELFTINGKYKIFVSIESIQLGAAYCNLFIFRTHLNKNSFNFNYANAHIHEIVYNFFPIFVK